jgi:hypothetical protein
VAKSIGLLTTQPDVAILAMATQITGQSIKLSYDKDCEQSCFKNFSPQQIIHFWHSFQMSISSPTPTNDTSIWTSLKQAISASSGFQHWASQLSIPERADLNPDTLVQRYLRETLETLAY